MAITVHHRPDEYVDTLSSLTYFSLIMFHKNPSRRQPPRGRHVRAQSPLLDSPEPETTAPVQREPTEAELRLTSSDLSDCEDIWYTEIGYYMLETRRRRRMVEDFFESNLAVSSSWFSRESG
jgi:chromatin-remodeling ATPase INO80